MSRLPPPANTTIDPHGVIFGHDFGDGYFSRDDGLAETRAVYLAGNQLPEAWAETSCFVIGELGFGTGLNVLATWDLWKRHRPAGGILHIITVEGFLLEAETARQAHLRWPELDALSQKLVARWPTRSFGAQRIWFPEDGICITFLIGPCEDALSAMDFAANCWFLDGFSPAKNPDMWSLGVFEQIARLSAQGATLATYTVAGFVRQGLSAVGFELIKAPGFGSKRERLQGRLAPRNVVQTPTSTFSAPQTALIIGGGIAGAGLCAALAKRNIHIEQCDADPCGQTKASGNPIALIMPRLDLADTREARFFRASYLMAIDHYGQIGPLGFRQSGIVEMPGSSGDTARLTSLITDPPLPPDHLGADDENCVIHRRAGIIFPDEILKSSPDQVRRHPVVVARIERIDDRWCAFDVNDKLIAQGDICVIANGMAASAFCDFGIKLRPRAGQLSWADVDGTLPDTPISGGNYAAPFGTKLVFGATYEHCDMEGPFPVVTEEGHLANRDALAKIAPDLAARIDIESARGRKSIRATTNDNLPIIGAVSGAQEGLYVVTALGSRGFTTAILGGEIIASLACGEPSPVERHVSEALGADRFILRAAKRKKPAI